MYLPIIKEILNFNLLKYKNEEETLKKRIQDNLKVFLLSTQIKINLNNINKGK